MANVKRILIVEDNPMNMELVSDLLESVGYRVLHAFSAEEALPLAHAEKPELVLMDLALPGIDGLEATRRLQQDAATRDIPVVALTASAMQSDAEKALLAGCRGVIRKPIDTRSFPKLIADYLVAESKPTTQVEHV